MEFPFIFYWKLRKSQGFLLHVNLMFPRIILYMKLMCFIYCFHGQRIVMFPRIGNVFHAVSTDKAL